MEGVVIRFGLMSDYDDPHLMGRFGVEAGSVLHSGIGVRLT